MYFYVHCIPTSRGLLRWASAMLGHWRSCIIFWVTYLQYFFVQNSTISELILLALTECSKHSYDKCTAGISKTEQTFWSHQPISSLYLQTCLNIWMSYLFIFLEYLYIFSSYNIIVMIQWKQVNIFICKCSNCWKYCEQWKQALLVREVPDGSYWQ